MLGLVGTKYVITGKTETACDHPSQPKRGLLSDQRLTFNLLDGETLTLSQFSFSFYLFFTAGNMGHVFTAT